MARTYKRDARGRFAGGGGGSGGGRKSAKLPAPTKRTATGKTKRQGLLTQRAAVSAAQAKLKSKDPADRSLTGQLSLRAQKAAVTRAKNKLAAAQKTGRIRLSGRDGVIRPRKGGAKKVVRDYLSKEDIQRKSARRTTRVRGSKGKKLMSKLIADEAASVYRSQEMLRNTGRLTQQVIRKGVPYPERSWARSKAFAEIKASTRRRK